MNVFADTCIVNRFQDLDKKITNSKWEEDRNYLLKLQSGPVATRIMKIFVNPSLIQQVRDTPNHERRRALIASIEKFEFTEFNTASFPFSFLVRLYSEIQKVKIQQLFMDYPHLEPDKKIIADSAFNQNIDVLLTTDRDLAKLKKFGKVKIMLPKDLWEYYRLHKPN